MIKILILSFLALSGLITIMAIGYSIGEPQDELLHEKDKKSSKRY